MRMISMLAAAALVAASTSAFAGPLNTSTPAATPAPITLVQEKKETVTEKVKRNVKRTWKNLVGYKFVASCPAIFPVNHYNCNETGKNREEARGKCAARHAFCLIRDAG